MYEVFFNDRKIVISSPGNNSFIKDEVIAEKLNSFEELKNWFLDFATTEKKLTVLLHSSPKKFWNNLFLPLFKQIPAAGGVVIRNNKMLNNIVYSKCQCPLPSAKLT